jgi:hypothetical protein
MKRRPKLYQTDDGVTHCDGWNGNDFTLCGFTLDGDQGGVLECTDPKDKINCCDCIRIVGFCASIDKRLLKRNAR